MENYLKECCLVNPSTKEIVKKPPLTQKSMDELCPCCQQFDLAIVGGLENSVIYGSSNPTMNDEAPVYVHVVQNGGKLYIQYALFYAYNGATAVLGGALWIGEHQADIENVTAEIENNELKGYYLSHHGDETFYSVEDLEKHGDRVKIYVARGSHANYPAPKAYRRVYGCAWDVADANGYLWEPKKYVYLVNPDEPGYNPETMGFMRLRGHMGDGLTSGSVLNLPSKNWWMKGHEDATDDDGHLTDRQLYKAGHEYLLSHPRAH